jgi:putative oxidoreductase
VEYLFLIGRLLYGGFFLVSGLDHFRKLGTMAPYAAAKGVPAPKLAVTGSGTLIILGGLSIILGFRPEWGVLLLSLFLVPTSFSMHSFWADTDPQMRQHNLINFTKNIALLGAAWMILLIPTPWAMSVGG